MIEHARYQREQNLAQKAAAGKTGVHPRQRTHAVTPSLPPQIIFEDPHLVVVNKPAGLLTQEDVSGDSTLVDWLRIHFGRQYVGTIHRLDRNTSGIMLFAKRTKSASRLSEALRENKIKRTYLAWLHGEIRNPQKWAHWLLKDETKNHVRVVSQRTRDAKEAVLHLKPIRYAQLKGVKLTLAEIELETGRSHQIRVQCAAKGFPIAGDPKYGADQDKLFPRPALHSFQVSFPHPMDGEIKTFVCPLPKDLNIA